MANKATRTQATASVGAITQDELAVGSSPQGFAMDVPFDCHKTQWRDRGCMVKIVSKTIWLYSQTYTCCITVCYNCTCLTNDCMHNSVRKTILQMCNVP